jgi:hypothetical protein
LFEEGFEVVVAGAQEDVPEVATACVVSDVVAMMVIVEGGAAYEGEDSEGSPGEFIASMALVSQNGLVGYPKEVCEAMHFAAKQNHGQR